MTRAWQAFSRFVVAAAMVVLGWCGQILAYVTIAPGAGSHDTRVWALYSGVFCALALLCLGVPVSLMNPVRYLGPRQMRAILLSATAGAALMLLPPAVYLFFMTIPLGAAVGALAMWGFTFLVSLSPRLFGSPESSE